MLQFALHHVRVHVSNKWDLRLVSDNWISLNSSGSMVGSTDWSNSQGRRRRRTPKN
jgi:hypothetical protein